MNKTGFGVIAVAAALVIAGASSAGTVALRPASIRVVTRTVTVTATAMVTRIRTHTRVVYRASPSPAPVAASVRFACKIEQTGGGSEEYEVDALGGAAYSGTVDVSFYGSVGSGDTFPPTSLPGTAPAGSAANWHPVPPADIGASAEPTGCIASAPGG